MAELLTRMCHILKFSFTHGTFQLHPQQLDLEAPPSLFMAPYSRAMYASPFPNHMGHPPIKAPRLFSR